MKRYETKRYSSETETKRNEITQKRKEAKRNKNKTFRQKKILTPCSDLIILFLCTSPVAIENITAQVHDVYIFTAHWAQFTFWQPKKAIFIRLLPASITFFRQKKLMI
jgi:hypothetical protein